MIYTNHKITYIIYNLSIIVNKINKPESNPGIAW